MSWGFGTVRVLACKAPEKAGSSSYEKSHGLHHTCFLKVPEGLVVLLSGGKDTLNLSLFFFPFLKFIIFF